MDCCYILLLLSTMSIISPTTCGFAKVSLFNIFTGGKVSQENDENLAMYRSRELEHQFGLWQSQFIGYNEKFSVEYKHFKKYDPKIVSHFRNLGKTRSVDKDIVLHEFSNRKWNELLPEKKSEHQLFNCNGCLNDTELKQTLGLFLITAKFKKLAMERGISKTKSLQQQGE